MMGRSCRGADGDPVRCAHYVDELHDQHRRAVDLAGVVGLDDVRVCQSADGLHLAIEAGERLSVSHAASGKDLQGNHAIELRVQRLVDRAHAPLSELTDELVFPEGFGKRRGRCGFRRSRDDGTGPRNGQLALGFIEEGVVGGRLAQECQECVFHTVKRGQARLAFGTGKAAPRQCFCMIRRRSTTLSSARVPA
jgi:hypothetical protein